MARSSRSLLPDDWPQGNTPANTRVIAEALDTQHTSERRTPWREQVVAMTNGEFVVLPQYGVSQVRDITTTQNGATIQEQGGFIHLDTDAQADSLAELQTRQRGAYKPRMTAVVSAYLEIPNPGNWGPGHDLKLGALDERNGAGLGHDSDGAYVFHRNATTTTTIPQSSWNVDTLDGTGDADNPSGLALDLTNATIVEVVWHWYGRGTIQYWLQVKDGDEVVFVLAHERTVEGPLFEDPNLPIQARLENNAETTGVNARVGGRSYARQGGDVRLSRRPVPATVTGLTITETSWTPVAGVRVKSTHRGRPTSVPVFFNSLDLFATNFTRFKVGYLDTVTSTPTGGWSRPSGWAADETVVEVVAQNANRDLAASEDGPGVPLNTFHPGGAPQSRLALQREQRLALNRGDQLVLYAQRRSNNSDIDVAITLDEER